MPKYLEEFNPPVRLLLGPGPSNVNPRVLQAMSAPLLGHLDPVFLDIMDDVRDMLRIVFKTKNEITIPISGTGSAGMETAIVNVIEPGDTMIVGINGYFGERIAQIGERAGATVARVNAEWGLPLDPDKLNEELKKHKRVKAVAMVHAETSTGVRSPAKEITALAHDHDALVIIDTVTSLGGVEVAMDDWDADVSYSGTQKCLGCPPGLAPVTFGHRAEKVISNRKTPVQSWYLDTSLLKNYWSENRAYHHTAPISMVYGLREGLRVVLEEGLENRFSRHEYNAAALRKGIEAMGMEMFAQEDARLPTLNTVRIPDGIDDAKVRRSLLTEHNIEIGGGLGPVAGKIWRIGLMGENSNKEAVVSVLSALEVVLNEQEARVAPGAGVSAAEAFYSS